MNGRETTSGSTPSALTRETLGLGTPAPVRIVHIGLGAFHRSHQAWYTQAADPAGEWGIAAFTGRTPAAARTLAAQDSLYTLVERGPDGDKYEVISSLSAVYEGTDLNRLATLLAAPTTAVVTMTITEAAYHLGPDGRLDLAAGPVASDLALLAGWVGSRGDLRVPSTGESSVEQPETAQLTTVGARMLVGLDARRRAGSGPLAVVPCDNLSGNGAAAAEAILGLAREIDAGLAEWVQQQVSFVDTSVDRITPRITDDDVAAVAAATGFADASPVVAEPFSNWVLSGNFPVGRPAWEKAGAVFVDDIEHFERRKLWLLNGAHSLLAYAGQLRGHRTVAEALVDPVCRDWLEAFWDEAAAYLTEPGLEIPAYRAALLQRFANPRIAHQLKQIAMDGSSKLRMRAVPIIAAHLRDGRPAPAACRLAAAWMDQTLDTLSDGGTVTDPQSEALAALAGPTDRAQTQALLRLLSEDLAADGHTVDYVHRLRGSWLSESGQ